MRSAVLLIAVAACYNGSLATEYRLHTNSGIDTQLLAADGYVSIRIKPEFQYLTPDSLVAHHPELIGDPSGTSLGSGYSRYQTSSAMPSDSILALARSWVEVEAANPAFMIGRAEIAWMTDELRACFSPTQTTPEIDSVCASLGIVPHDSGIDMHVTQLLHIRIPSDQSLIDVMDALLLDSILSRAEVNFTYAGNAFASVDSTTATSRHAESVEATGIRATQKSPQLYPNDSLFPYQWHLWNEFAPTHDIDARQAWDVTTGSPDVTIGVIDAGFQATFQWFHFELLGLVTVNEYDAGGEDIFTTGCPCPDYSVETCPDTNWNCVRGTNVLGMISSRLNNYHGLAGLAPGCKIMPIKAWDDQGISNDPVKLDALAQVLRVTGDRPRVLVIGFAAVRSDTMETLLRLIYEAGIVTVCPGGELAPPTSMVYPATSPWVIGVGGTTAGDYWSAYCSDTALDIVAPARNLWTLDLASYDGRLPNSGDDCLPGVDYDISYQCRASGTLLAAPLVAGTAGLVLSRRPDLLVGDDPVENIRNVLYGSAEDTLGDDDLDIPGRDNFFGWGRVNAFRALLSVCRGDINNDGVINLQDVTLSVSVAWLGGESGAAWHPALADLDCNGFTNVQDVVGVVNVAFRGYARPAPCYEFEY